ncbi:MAG: SGNH/GDSL hydrolase family protein [Pseudomonadota bacterium]|nr:SGNH/GDSL hydrolase family protein [Pseudomonadota bacterium]
MNKKLLLILGVLTFVFLFFSAMNCSGQLRRPTQDEAVALILAYLLIGLIVTLLIVKGRRYTLFISIPYLIVLIMLELGVRLWISSSDDRQLMAFYAQFMSSQRFNLGSLYLPHHYSVYHLRPHLALANGLKHNRLGLRDHRDLKSKADQVIRIVFMGGSTTYTIGIKDNKQIFSAGLERQLNQYYQDKGYQIQVINAGMGGATSAENLIRLIFFVSEIEADLVVIQHGLNDVWPRIYGDIQTDFGNYRRRWQTPQWFDFCVPHKPLTSSFFRSLAAESALMTFILNRLGYYLIKPLTIADFVTHTEQPRHHRYLTHNDSRYFERNTRYMIAIARSMGAQVLLLTEAYTDKAAQARQIAMPEHNRLLAEIAQSEQVLFYDFYNDMIKDTAHMPDGRHVNQRGSDKKRDLLVHYFIQENIVPKLAESKR